MRTFFGELKRRRVYRVALAYGIFASAMIQVGGTILPIFHAHQWVQQVFIVLIAAGFPLALILGWVYDITAEGIQRTPNARGLRVYRRRQLWLVALSGTLIATAALAGYWFWHPWASPTEEDADASGNATPAKSIAVLPFQNLSPDNAGAFFADGVQDQILTNLAKVSDLKVISHTSVEQYRNEVGRNVREIGRQLGVAYILEGTVRRAIDRVTAKLEGRHWMYQNAPDRLALIKMCEECRVIAVTEAGFDPHAAPERPRVRTTDDYLRERERKRDD